ncbi:MAG: hypothetical protein WA691_10130 [Thermoplasmata archaeon]
MGDIPTAFEVTLGYGPVRIAFTDQRILVPWTGPHQFLPSKRVYMAWKGAIPTLPRTRVLNGPWVAGTEAPAWEFDNSATIAVHVGKEHGLSPDPDVCDLAIKARSDGSRTTALGAMPLRPGSEGTMFWRIPGPAPAIDDFLRALPIAAVVR